MRGNSKTVFVSVVLLVGLLVSFISPTPAVAQQGPPGPETPTGASDGTPVKPPDTSQVDLPLAEIEGVANDYNWSQTLGTYTEITGGTQVTTSCDDTNYNNYALPFSFTFNGTVYTAISIQCNGFIAMGTSVTSSYSPISSGSTNNIIAALGNDLQTGAANSEIRYETLGIAPNQVFVIQWKNFRHYSGAQTYNFQIRLYETSNMVEVVYGAFTETSSYTHQIGLRGAANTDFNNRSSSTGWLNTVAGTLNTATVLLNTTYMPPSGLTWDWTPLPPHPVFTTSSKTAPVQALIGDPVAYAVHIINTGTADATAATLVDPIPLGTTYNGDVACTAGTCSYNAGLNQIEWSGSVAVAGQVDVTFSVDTVSAACGILANTATINDPGLIGGPVVKSASTQLVASLPAPLDGFEASVPPPGWTETIVFDPGTDPDWTQETAGTYPTILPHSGTYMAKFNSFSTGSGGSARLWTGAMDLAGYAAPSIVFWMSHDTGYTGSADRIQMQVSTDGVNWVNFGAPVLRYDPACTTPCWKEHAIPLPAGYNVSGVYIGFLGVSAYGNNFYLDDTGLAEGWYPCPYVTLSPDASKTGCLGGSLDYALTLTNMTPNVDTFDVTVAGNLWPTTVDPDALVLGPGGSALINVTVELPFVPGTDTAVVTALGEGFGGTDTATVVSTGLADGFWEPVPPEPDNGRMDNVAGAYNGMVWSITGYGANLNVRSYDPAAGLWTTVGTPPPFTGNYARSGCQAGSKVYMYGDTSTPGFTGLWSYDMATTTWLQETPGGTPPAQTGIWAPAWAYDPDDGLCYLTGGATAPGAGNLTTVYVYDTINNTWLDPLPDFTSVRDFHAAWVFTDNLARKLLCVAGGNNGVGLASTQCYDFDAAVWDAENADIGTLPADLWGMGYTQKVQNGITQLWVTGGVRAGVLSNMASFFDVAAGTWNDNGPIPGSPVYRTAAVTLNNELYTVGGSIGSFTYTGQINHLVQCPAVAPDIEVTPPSLAQTLLPDTTATQQLSICNAGNAPLDWTMSEAAPLNTLQLWSENFDSYATDTSLHGVNGWKGWGNSPAATAYTRDEQARSAPNSVEITGASDLVHEYSGVTSGQWIYTAWQYIPSSLIGDSYFILLNQYNDAGTLLNWSTEVMFSSATDLVSNDGPAGGTLPIIYDQWMEIKVIIDLNADIQQFYYGGSLLFQDSWTDGMSGGGILNLAAVDLYANNASPIYYDDFSLAQPGVDIPWLSEAPTTGTVPPGECQDVDVTFDSTGLATGDYYGDLLIDSNDADEPQVDVPVVLTVAEPNIQVTPSSLSSAQCPNTTETQQLNVCNIGTGTLDWTLSEAPAYNIPSYPEGLVDMTLGQPAAQPQPFLGGGTGPASSVNLLLDDFNRPDGPLGPNWTAVTGSCSVVNNGAACGGPGQALFNGAPGEGNAAEIDVAVLNTSLEYQGVLLNYGAGVSNLFIKVQNQSGGMQFCNAACYTGYNGGGPVFGLGFFGLSSCFTSAHMAVTRVGSDVTIEFTNVDGGAQPPQTYVCSGAPAPEGTGIGIVGYSGLYILDNFGIPGGEPDIPWLSETPTSGSVPAGECQTVDVTFDTLGMAPGDYSGDLLIDSNDPDEPQVDVPVALTVLAPVFGADFTWWPLEPFEDELVYFTATVTGGVQPIDYTWDYGDGTTDSGETVEHVYADPGTYLVTLTASNECGFTTVAKEIVIADECDPIVIADFTFAPTDPYVDETVTFTGMAEGGTLPYTFAWDFGDGTTGSGEVVDHAYAAAGEYTVEMIASNECSEFPVTYVVTVTEPPCEPLGGLGISWTPVSPVAGDEVTFVGTYITGTEPVEYLWDFGDGFGITNTHTYTAAGSYTVTMQAWNECTEPVTVVETILIAAECVPLEGLDIAWTPEAPVAGEEVLFEGTWITGTGPVEFLWDFGDGFGITATHTYTAAGSYTVTMQAWNECTEPVVIEKVITIAEAPPCEEPEGVDFMWTPEEPLTGEAVVFEGTVMTGTEPFTFDWLITDAFTPTPDITGTGQTFTYTFDAAGVYTVTLTVTNECGTETATATITVMAPVFKAYLPVILRATVP